MREPAVLKNRGLARLADSFSFPLLPLPGPARIRPPL